MPFEVFNKVPQTAFFRLSFAALSCCEKKFFFTPLTFHYSSAIFTLTVVDSCFFPPLFSTEF